MQQTKRRYLKCKELFLFLFLNSHFYIQLNTANTRWNLESARKISIWKIEFVKLYGVDFNKRKSIGRIFSTCNNSISVFIFIIIIIFFWFCSLAHSRTIPITETCYTRKKSTDDHLQIKWHLLRWKCFLYIFHNFDSFIKIYFRIFGSNINSHVRDLLKNIPSQY